VARDTIELDWDGSNVSPGEAPPDQSAKVEHVLNNISNQKRKHTMVKRKVPRFQTEKEEAGWSAKNRTELDKDFVKAAREGRLKRLSREQLSAPVTGARRVISLRLIEGPDACN